MGRYEKRSEGKWIEDSSGSWICTVCGCIIYPFEIENGMYNYCPHCGSYNPGSEELIYADTDSIVDPSQLGEEVENGDS